MPGRLPERLDGGPGSPLSRPSPEQIAREIRNAAAVETAERAWRRSVRLALAAGLLSVLLANLIGLSAWLVADEELGGVLLLAAEAGVVLFPFLIGVSWTFAAHQRGDL